MDIFNNLIFLLDSMVRLTVPLLLAALAGLYSERSGVFDIGLEGKMLAGAFGAASIAYLTGNMWLGMFAGIGIGIVMALIHGIASITFRGNQIIAGVAINFLAAGLTVFLGQSWFKQGGNTPALPEGGRFLAIELPFADALKDVPIIGPIYYELISGHNIIVYIAFAMVPFTYWLLFKTRFGLRLRAVGENPKAVDTAGINVNLMRFKAVLICGALTGLAGAYLSIALSAGFVKNMTAGMGFIALAALIFAKWRPLYVLYATLLFGFLNASQIRLQGVELPIIGEVPVQAIQALPYILTVVLLAGFIGKAVGPKAGGIPYVKER
ncbi:MAG: ABC transporter permease [Devosiaceae bacterium]|nr:ABC transporter permease [Devosiaceae bacterium]